MPGNLIYDVKLTPRAEKEIVGLPKADQRKVVRKLDALATTPRPPGVEKLKENPAFWRIKAGKNHRIVYTILDKERLVIVAVVRNRKDAYRGLSKLDPVELLSQLQPFLEQRPTPPDST